MDELNLVLDSIKKLDAWISKNNWKAYDPLDGLSAKAAKLLTLNNHYLKIMWQQSVRRFPFNLRPLLGIRFIGVLLEFFINFCIIKASREIKWQ